MAAENVDVLICGAGPVGLTLAVECQRHGLSARIIDRLEKPSPYSKALAVWSSALEVFESMGCARTFLDHSIPAEVNRLSSKGRFLAEVPLRISARTRYPQPIILPQSETERILTERLSALGGGVERGLELTGFEQDAEGVSCDLRNPDGRTETVRARWLVGCDGSRSLVRKTLGIGFTGDSVVQTFVLCDVRVEPPPPRGTMQADMVGGSMLAIFPVTDGVWRVIGDREPGGPDASHPPDLEEMRRLLVRHGRAAIKISDPSWLAAFRIGERRAESYREGRVLLAGDAAHIHSPTGGQGMNLGVQDAYNLAWKLALLTRGHGEADALLDSYECERAPVADEVIRNSGRLLRLGLMDNPVAGAARNIIFRALGRLPGVQTRMQNTLSGLQVRYRTGPLVGNDDRWEEDWRSHGFRSGERIRDVELSCPERKRSCALVDELNPTGHTLLLFSGKSPTSARLDRLRQFEHDFFTRAAAPVKVIRVRWGVLTACEPGCLADPSGVAHRLFGAQNESAYLVRPDQFVAARAMPPDMRAFDGYCDAALRITQDCETL